MHWMIFEEVEKDKSEAINGFTEGISSIVVKKEEEVQAGQLERDHRSILCMGNTFSKGRGIIIICSSTGTGKKVFEHMVTS